MRYSGSKKRYAKEIGNIITKFLSKDTYYIEPFVGGANLFSTINHNKKIGIDINECVIDLWKNLQKGLDIPFKNRFLLTEWQYESMKYDYYNGMIKYPKWMLGYVGNCCSYGSALWNGYAKYNAIKDEDHIKEAYNGLIRQLDTFYFLKECIFVNTSYDMYNYPPNSVIYCDPPYSNTKGYGCEFNNDKFWEWCRKMSKNGHKVFISEYNAPSDFVCVWIKQKKDGMGTTYYGNKQNTKIEKLFTYNI